MFITANSKSPRQIAEGFVFSFHSCRRVAGGRRDEVGVGLGEEVEPEEGAQLLVGVAIDEL